MTDRRNGRTRLTNGRVDGMVIAVGLRARRVSRAGRAATKYDPGSEGVHGCGES